LKAARSSLRARATSLKLVSQVSLLSQVCLVLIQALATNLGHQPSGFGVLHGAGGGGVQLGPLWDTSSGVGVRLACLPSPPGLAAHLSGGTPNWDTKWDTTACLQSWHGWHPRVFPTCMEGYGGVWGCSMDGVRVWFGVPSLAMALARQQAAACSSQGLRV
jgi:hypothetical protein